MSLTDPRRPSNLFGLAECLGEAGCLKMLRLDDYALRRGGGQGCCSRRSSRMARLGAERRAGCRAGRHPPRKDGSSFSRNALVPSRKSSVAATRPK